MTSIPNPSQGLPAQPYASVRPTAWSLTLTDWGLLLIRCMIGVVFLFHGSQKLFGLFDGAGISGFAGFLGKMGVPIPVVSAWVSACVEFFGGAALLLGWGVRLAVIPMIINMLVAILLVHSQAFSGQKGGMEYPLTLAVVMLGLGLTGPGQLSLSGLIHRTTHHREMETETQRELRME